MSLGAENTMLPGAMRWQALLEASQEGIFLTDSKGIIKMMNPAAERLFGYPANDVLGQHVSLLIPEFHVTCAEHSSIDPVEASLKETSCGHGQIEGRRKDGKRFAGHLCILRFTTEGEHVSANIIYHRISERRLSDQLQQIVAVFEHTTVGLMITDLDGTIEAVNSAFTDLTGYTQDEIVGCHARLLKSSRHDPSYYAAIWQSVKDKGAWRGEMWNRGKNGEIYAVWLSVSALRNSLNDVTHYLAVYTDITPLKNSEQHLNYLAHHDPLTGLANRLLLSARLDQGIRRQPRRGGTLALLVLDLDHFKQVNDTFGHNAGNLLLADVARRLTAAVRREDTVARLGGDEFAILLEHMAAPRDAALVAEEILSAFSYSFYIGGQEIYIGASIGISLFPQDGQSMDNLFQTADRAMYRAKQQREQRCGSYAFASDPDASEGRLESSTSDRLRQLTSSRGNISRAPITGLAGNAKPPGKFNRAAQVHERVLALADELLKASDGRSVNELAESLPELFDLLLMHFADEERKGGPFDTVRTKDRHHWDAMTRWKSSTFKS